MAESIIKYITKVNDINIGVGLAGLTGEIKLSPFTIQEDNIKIIQEDSIGIKQ